MKTRLITLSCNDCRAQVAVAETTRGARRLANERGAHMRYGKLFCAGCTQLQAELAKAFAV